MKRRELTLEDLSVAEACLELDIAEWRTDQLEFVAECPKNVLAPTEIPNSAAPHYGKIWWHLGVLEATELLKHMARPVLAGRSRERYVGKCPKCGADDAQVTSYDGGKYRKGVHLLQLADDTLALVGKGAEYRPTLTHYVGPAPFPTRYEG